MRNANPDPTLSPEPASLPEARPLSAREIVASLRADGGPGMEACDAFWELDRLPIDEVREALASWLGPEPDRHRLDAAICIAHGIPARPLHLRTLSVTRDADVLDLGPVAEEQLRLAGMSWDGVDRAPEERLDGELEGSFAGTLERRVLGDAEAPDASPLFDVLLFAEDTGVVFAAGTSTIVALIAYRKVEMRDRRTRVALEEALEADAAVAGAAPDEPVAAPVSLGEEPGAPSAGASRAVEDQEPRPEVTTIAEAPAEPKTTPAKGVSAKRAAAKTTLAKKPARRTAPAKTIAAKKAPAKKAPAKKAPAKKVASKKTPAKKVPAKKVPAKKTRSTTTRAGKSSRARR